MADIEKNPGAVSLDQLLQVLHALDARLLLADTQRYASNTPSPAPQANSPSTDW
jgi:HTH-type transcriptional regulator/antitoxin HipB